jgi:hypothetical protein
MSVLESIVEKTFDLVTQNAKASVTSVSATKVACAFPKGSDPAEFGPWSNQELKQVSFEQDPVTTSGVEIDFRISYKTSAAGQYLDEVFVDSLVKVPVPFSLDARIDFRDLSLEQNSDGLEMAAIPFVVTVARSHPVFGAQSFRADGVLRGDGQSSFGTFNSISA